MTIPRNFKIKVMPADGKKQKPRDAEDMSSSGFPLSVNSEIRASGKVVSLGGWRKN